MNFDRALLYALEYGFCEKWFRYNLPIEHFFSHFLTKPAKPAKQFNLSYHSSKVKFFVCFLGELKIPKNAYLQSWIAYLQSWIAYLQSWIANQQSWIANQQ